MDQKSARFIYLKNKFTRINYAKIKENMFAGPQVRGLIQDIKFEDRLRKVEKVAWKSFKNVTTIFGGKS
jgi:hypothetical protein